MPNVSFLLPFVIVASLRVERAFIDYDLVPDVISTPPLRAIGIQFPSGVKVDLGNELTPTQVKDKPTLFWESEQNAFYTLIMIDPDVPNRKEPTLSEVNHWMVINIPGHDVDAGQTVVAFLSSGPEKGTGLHRYTFLVFKQKKMVFYNGPVITTSRAARVNFSTRDYARQNKLGSPVAGNFYQAKYDDYVPTVLAQMN